jgi:hypothetical protein
MSQDNYVKLNDYLVYEKSGKIPRTHFSVQEKSASLEFISKIINAEVRVPILS